MTECVNCGAEFDPIKYRWLCPTCHFKAECCDGAPLASGGYYSDNDVTYSYPREEEKIDGQAQGKGPPLLRQLTSDSGGTRNCDCYDSSHCAHPGECQRPVRGTDDVRGNESDQRQRDSGGAEL